MKESFKEKIQQGVKFCYIADQALKQRYKHNIVNLECKEVELEVENYVKKKRKS